MSPALVGGFFTTEPPGKPLYTLNVFLHPCELPSRLTGELYKLQFGLSPL